MFAGRRYAWKVTFTGRMPNKLCRTLFIFTMCNPYPGLSFLLSQSLPDMWLTIVLYVYVEENDCRCLRWPPRSWA